MTTLQIATDCEGSTPGIVSGVVITRASIANNASTNSSSDAGRAAFAEQIFNKYNIVAAGLTFLHGKILRIPGRVFDSLGRLLGRPFHSLDVAKCLYCAVRQKMPSVIRKIERPFIYKDRWIYIKDER